MTHIDVYLFVLFYFSSAAISLDIVLAVMVLSPVSLVYQYMFLMPHLALDSAMACRVFRGVKLGCIQDAEDDTVLNHDSSLPTHTAVESADKCKMRNLEPHSFVIDVTITTLSGEPLGHHYP